MRYASVFFTIMIVWVAVVVIATIANNTGTTFQLYLITIFFTVMMVVFGFMRRR